MMTYCAEINFDPQILMPVIKSEVNEKMDIVPAAYSLESVIVSLDRLHPYSAINKTFFQICDTGQNLKQNLSDEVTNL